jgi:hypothetical protein
VEIDVSAWTVIRDEPGGRDKNKRWIAEDADAPRDQHWLWKYRQTTGDGSEAALTDCAEVFTSRLAAVIHLPAAECGFAIFDDRVCGRRNRRSFGGGTPRLREPHRCSSMPL